MHTLTPQRGDEARGPIDAQTGQLPRRPRRRFLTPRSAAFLALVTCAVGFYAGVRVEKGQVSSSPATATGAPAAGAAARGRLASLFRGSGRTGSARSGGGSGPAGALGGAGAPEAAAGAGGGASFGTVASVRGRTLYVIQVSGNTVRVRLSAQTKLIKSESVSRGAIHPGDTVVVQGVSGSGGTVTAASITDSGTRAGGSGTSSGSGGSGGSGVSSLFSSGG